MRAPKFLYPIFIKHYSPYSSGIAVFLRSRFAISALSFRHSGQARNRQLKDCLNNVVGHLTNTTNLTLFLESFGGVFGVGFLKQNNLE